LTIGILDVTMTTLSAIAFNGFSLLYVYIKIKIWNTWIYRTFILSKLGLH